MRTSTRVPAGYPAPLALARHQAGAWFAHALGVSAAVSMVGAIIALVIGALNHDGALAFSLEHWLPLVMLLGTVRASYEACQRLVTAVRTGMARREAYLTSLAATAGATLGFLPYVLLTLAATWHSGTGAAGTVIHVEVDGAVTFLAATACACLSAWGLSLALECLQVAWRRWGTSILPALAVGGIILVISHSALAEPGVWDAGRIIAQTLRALLPSELYVLKTFSEAAQAAGWALMTGPLTLWLLLRRWEPPR